MLRRYRSNADDDRIATSHAVTVDTNGDDTASIPDFDGDGTIGFGDFLIFAGVFGQSLGDEKYDDRVDLDGDGEIGFSDFVIFAQNFGRDAPSPAVTIPDANLRAAIEAALGKATGAPITQIEMRTLTRLDASFAGVSDLTGLEFAISLTHLNFWDNRITDLSPLSGLTKLTSLKLSYNGFNITDISPLAGLANLTELGLFYTNVSDISPLASLTNLTRLSLGSEDIMVTDISPLAGLTKLNYLFLARNAITDISPLSGLTNLIVLQLSGNPITDLSMLASWLRGLTNLTTLNLGATGIADISALAGLTNLTSLNLGFNAITDVSTLASLPNLRYLGLDFNNITDVSTQMSVLGSMTDLVSLSLGYNNITDVSPLSGLTNLITLSLNRNAITDVSTLASFTNLRYLGLDFNNITDMSALASLTNLTNLDLRANPLSDSSINDYIPVLERRGVRVSFDRFRKGEFDIELVFSDDFNEAQKNVFRYVARRWMAVITKDLPDFEFTQGWSGTCGGQSYEIPSGERIDDLRIYLSSFVGGSAVGYGGPSLLREENRLPVLGCMSFDLTGPYLMITGLHEIGHVLGFTGTVWNEFGYLKNLSRDDPNADTHFSGPLAIAAFDDAGGRDYAGRKVPVKRMDGSHWRYSVLKGEVMGPQGGVSLSAITVQSLADLGYGVDVTQADPYTLPGANAGKAVAKITSYQPSALGSVLDVTRAHPDGLDGAELYGQGGIAGGFPSIFGDDGPTGRLESAERVWGRGMNIDLADERQMWGTAPPASAEPELTCGAALINEPIYVVDPQGRVVRTIGQ